MKTASVTELKARLSHYLRMVRRGSEVQICERGVPIAYLVGLLRMPKGKDTERIDRLSRDGIVRRGSGDLRWVLDEPPLKIDGGQISDAISEDRRDRL